MHTLENLHKQEKRPPSGEPQQWSRLAAPSVLPPGALCKSWGWGSFPLFQLELDKMTFWEPPDVGLTPTGVWTSPPIPHCNWRTLPSSQTPSLPALSFPLPPTPLGSFCKAPGGGGPGWWRGGVLGRKGVEGGGPPSGTWGQTHIWGYSNFKTRCKIVTRSSLKNDFKTRCKIVTRLSLGSTRVARIDSDCHKPKNWLSKPNYCNNWLWKSIFAIRAIRIENLPTPIIAILDFESQFLQKPTSSNPSRSGVNQKPTLSNPSPPSNPSRTPNMQTNRK